MTVLTCSKTVPYRARLSWLKMQNFAKKSTAKRRKKNEKAALRCRRESSRLSAHARPLAELAESERTRTMFPSSGHTGVMDSGQPRARGSRGVHVVLIGGAGARGDNGTRMNRCWRRSRKTLKSTLERDESRKAELKTLTSKFPLQFHVKRQSHNILTGI